MDRGYRLIEYELACIWDVSNHTCTVPCKVYVLYHCLEYNCISTCTRTGYII